VTAVILIGIQGSGKSTFYQRRFAATHLRISRDIAGTRPREQRLIQRCLEQKQDFVIDNTNPTIEGRKKYIESAKAGGFRVIGFFFSPDIKRCLERNAQRSGKAKVPVPGIYRTLKQLQSPSSSEGFDELYEVHLEGEEFVVKRRTNTLD
jgi:predicted kinase